MPALPRYDLGGFFALPLRTESEFFRALDVLFRKAAAGFARPPDGSPKTETRLDGAGRLFVFVDTPTRTPEEKRRLIARLEWERVNRPRRILPISLAPSRSSSRAR